MVTKTYLKLTYLCDSIESSDCSDSSGSSDNSDSSDSSDSNDSRDSSDQKTSFPKKNVHQKAVSSSNKKFI